LALLNIESFLLWIKWLFLLRERCFAPTEKNCNNDEEFLRETLMGFLNFNWKNWTFKILIDVNE
jgi:hypothetical protein